MAFQLENPIYMSLLDCVSSSSGMKWSDQAHTPLLSTECPFAVIHRLHSRPCDILSRGLCMPDVIFMPNLNIPLSLSRVAFSLQPSTLNIQVIHISKHSAIYRILSQQYQSRSAAVCAQHGIAPSLQVRIPFALPCLVLPLHRVPRLCASTGHLCLLPCDLDRSLPPN